MMIRLQILLSISACASQLGAAYMNGERGLPINLKCASMYLRAAADQGYATAIAALKHLRTCSWCNGGGARRTCRGCMKVRYCDGACQTRHWKEHREHCGPCRCARCRSGGGGDQCGSDGGESDLEVPD